MVYGPIAAYLVEAFPAKIRYTALSLPYHIGNGVFGGVLPLVGLSLIAATGNIFSGLYYPIAFAAITFLVGSFLLKETKSVLIWKELETARPGPLKSNIEGPALHRCRKPPGLPVKTINCHSRGNKGSKQRNKEEQRREKHA